MYGMAQSIPDRKLVSDIASVFYDAYYDTKTVKAAKTTARGRKGVANGASPAQ